MNSQNFIFNELHWRVHARTIRDKSLETRDAYCRRHINPWRVRSPIILPHVDVAVVVVVVVNVVVPVAYHLLHPADERGRLLPSSLVCKSSSLYHRWPLLGERRRPLSCDGHLGFNPSTVKASEQWTERRMCNERSRRHLDPFRDVHEAHVPWWL